MEDSINAERYDQGHEDESCEVRSVHGTRGVGETACGNVHAEGLGPEPNWCMWEEYEMSRPGHCMQEHMVLGPSRYM
jgi:hypothetical protein